MINNLGTRFIDIANRKKNNKAIILNNKSITFNSLNLSSDKICYWLLKKNFSTSDLVCISSEKSFFNFSLIIALLKLGITYVVLDLDSPIKRVNQIINQVKPKAILLSETNPINIKYKKNIFFKKNIDFSIKNEKKKLLNYISNVPSSINAYLMFTSGSTGLPKGVAISHSKLLFFSDWCKETFKINSSDRATNINPLFFDNSVFDIYGALFNGASLVPLSKKDIINPLIAANKLKKNKITIWFSVPSLIIYFQKFSMMNRQKFPSLKKIIFGGEGFPKKNLKSLYYNFSKKINIYNVYGPTECTCICSSYKISKNDFSKREMSRLAPFGKTLAKNFKYLILNEKLKKVKIGQIGELHIGGDNVGNGYYNQSDETKIKFIQNPEHNSYTEIFYKTGDLVYVDKKSKLIYFSSRKDNQIKLNGYRIELDDIENKLNLIKGIKESIVTFGRKKKVNEITAWVVSKLYEKSIYQKLSKSLPSYMMPKKILYIKLLPKNSNGKIDRKVIKSKYYD
jgi:D-alanine--poly(phosphoribitol) ligase subunit 1